MHTYIHIYINTCAHNYIHTYIATNIHTYAHTHAYIVYYKYTKPAQKINTNEDSQTKEYSHFIQKDIHKDKGF